MYAIRSYYDPEPSDAAAVPRCDGTALFARSRQHPRRKGEGAAFAAPFLFGRCAGQNGPGALYGGGHRLGQSAGLPRRGSYNFV